MKGSDKAVEFFRGKLRFFQHRKHKISVDLVLFIASLGGVRRSSKVVDIGAGFGFLSLTLAKKYGCRVTALERDKEMLELLVKNIELNGLEGFVDVVECDIRKVDECLGGGKYDLAMVNPPFFKDEGGEGIHREGDTELADFIRAGAFLLKDGGRLSTMIPSFRLMEAAKAGGKHNLHPRLLTALFPKIDRPSRICFLTFVKNVNGPLHFNKPLIVNNPDGSYTQEVSTVLEGFLS